MAVLIGTFLAGQNFASRSNDKNRIIIRILSQEQYLQEAQDALSSIEMYHDIYLSTNRDTILKSFNKSVYVLTEELSFYDSLFNLLPQYSKDISAITKSVKEKIGIMQNTLADPQKVLNSSSFISENNKLSNSITEGFVLLKNKLKAERKQNAIQNIDLQKNLQIILIAGLVITLLLLFVFYYLNKKQIKNCNSCDNRILLNEIEQSKITRSRIDFLSTVLDETRGSMTRIINTSSLLLQGNLSGEQKLYADIIKSNSIVLLTVVNDLLDLSKMETGSFHLKNAPFIIKDCIDEVLFLMAKENKIKITYGENIPEMIHGDHVKLRQMLISILGNMINLDNDWKITIAVNLLSETTTETNIEFRLSAIKNENSDEIILHKPETIQTTSGGFSIGLSLCARLSPMFGGNFRIESKGTTGSVIIFSIKAKKVNNTSTISIEKQKGIWGEKVDATLSKKFR